MKGAMTQATASASGGASASKQPDAVQGPTQPASANAGFQHVATGFLSLPLELLSAICDLTSVHTLFVLSKTSSPLRAWLHGNAEIWTRRTRAMPIEDVQADHGFPIHHLTAKERCLLLYGLACWCCYRPRRYAPISEPHLIPIPSRAYCYCEGCRKRIYPRRLTAGLASAKEAMETFDLTRAEVEQVGTQQFVTEWTDTAGDGSDGPDTDEYPYVWYERIEYKRSLPWPRSRWRKWADRSYIIDEDGDRRPLEGDEHDMFYLSRPSGKLRAVKTFRYTQDLRDLWLDKMHASHEQVAAARQRTTETRAAAKVAQQDSVVQAEAVASRDARQQQVRVERRQIVADVRREQLASAGLPLPSLADDPVAEALLRADWLGLIPAGLVTDEAVIAELLLRQQQRRLGAPLPNMHARDADIAPAGSLPASRKAA